MACASSNFCAETTSSSKSTFMRLYDFSAISRPAFACSTSCAAACICSRRAPFLAICSIAEAASTALCACVIFASTSGASMMASVSPACTMSPSFTRSSRMRPGTLPDTRYSSTSISPCITSGSRPKARKPMSATIATTAEKPATASRMLLCCSFALSAIIFLNYNSQFPILIS